MSKKCCKLQFHKERQESKEIDSKEPCQRVEAFFSSTSQVRTAAHSGAQLRQFVENLDLLMFSSVNCAGIKATYILAKSFSGRSLLWKDNFACNLSEEKEKSIERKAFSTEMNK